MLVSIFHVAGPSWGFKVAQTQCLWGSKMPGPMGSRCSCLQNIMINFLLKVAGMWIQDWSGKIVTDFGTRVFWNWRWNETWYPNLDTVIRWNLAFLESKSFLWSQDQTLFVQGPGCWRSESDGICDGSLERGWRCLYWGGCCEFFRTFFPVSDILLRAGGPLVEVHKWVPGKKC